MQDDKIVEIGKFIRQQTDEVARVADKSINEAITGVRKDIDDTKSALAKLFDELNARLESEMDDSEARRALSVLKTQEIFNDKLEALESGLTEAVSEKASELEARFDDLNSGVSKLVEATEEEAAEIRRSHVEQIQALTEQLKGQQQFEAMLTARLAEIKDGEKGEQGFQGEPGQDGQDRPLLEPVQIDDSKDYPKNVLGTFNNGLWISTKSTVGGPENDPHAWHCVLDAMATMRFELQQDHTYKLSVRMATGQLIEDEVYIPYHEHVGIWEDGKSYKAGNWVTKGSCMWQAMEDNPGTPPGNGWKQILSAKRGAKGEKGERGEQGERGIPGRNGLDATLPEGFTDQLLEIANKVFEDDRSGAYAVTSFRGWFMPNEAYRSGDLVNYDGSLYLCTSGGAYRSIAESNGAFELVVGVPKVAAQTFMLWQGEWGASRTYNTGNTVRDAGGTYVSTTYNNTERPSPQTIGSPVWVSGEGDTPAWSAEASAAASAISYGQRYTYSNDGFANRLRMWVDEADPNITYEVFSRPEPNGDNPTLNQIFPETSFGQTGWFTINISQLLILAGSVFDLLVFKRNRASSTTADYEYVYSTPQNAAVPAAGQIQHGRSATDELRINVVDNQGQDRSAAFAVLVPGDKISGAGVIWTIIDIVDNGTWYLFEVTPAVIGTDGTGNFTFETFTALPINYVRIVDHYASNIEGLYSDTAGNTVISSNMYGIDLEYQQASISSNWDVVTPASNYRDGAGGFSFTAEQTGWVKARAARVELSGVETPDNQWTELARMPVDKGEAYTFEYAITCKRLDDFGFGNSRYGALVQHNGGLEVSSEAMYENLPAGLDTRASTDGNDLVFEVNGRTGQNWFWTLDMDVVEL